MKRPTLFFVGLSLVIQLSAEAVASPACEPGKGYVAVDLAGRVDDVFLSQLKASGIDTVIRYYDWNNETLLGKTLTRFELDLVAKHDMKIAVVFQHNNDSLSTFISKNRGEIDGDRAVELATALSQPTGSAVYFGVDGVDSQLIDLISKITTLNTDNFLNKFLQIYVSDYFDRISQKLRPSGYKIGVYGSGKVCKYLLDKQLADYCWLASAKNWPGYEEFERSKKWVLKQHGQTSCFGKEVDLNSGNDLYPDFGQWKPPR